MKLLLIQVGWVSFNNNKAKNPAKYIAGKFELERTGFIDLLLQCLLWKVWNHSDEKNFISCFDEANKSWVGFINSKYRAEVCIILWSMMAEVRLVRKIHKKAEVKHIGLNRLEWNCKVLFHTWGKT